MRRLLFSLLLASQPVLAQKTGASLECKYTGKDFIYDCRIALQRGGEPLSGAEITVGADMPSMPMAHNIKPVKAKATSKPGEYQARLDLEMPGEWAVKLRISGPVRDQLVLHYTFTESGIAPRK
jgi:YtkA-like